MTNWKLYAMDTGKTRLDKTALLSTQNTYFLSVLLSHISHFYYDVASGSEITPCNKINNPLVVYRLTGNATTSITTLRT